MRRTKATFEPELMPHGWKSGLPLPAVPGARHGLTFVQSPCFESPSTLCVRSSRSCCADTWLDRVSTDQTLACPSGVQGRPDRRTAGLPPPSVGSIGSQWSARRRSADVGYRSLPVSEHVGQPA